jgi:alkanesulfonate monooxygenase SsuD/methylene tetrahydromethanopterin reductase-like flavin-dependent oxidoreductase (luciferase family)
MKFHVILEANNSHLEIARLAQLAEGYGMAGIWTSNMHDSRDPFINFVEAARVTKTIGLGPVAVSPYELHPLKMANALLTLNEISGGRAHIGVGAGDGGTATAMGIKAVKRVRAVRECVEIIEKAATGKPLTYKGGMYQVMYYHSSWVTQPPPDVFVCAGGPQMIESSARYAQGIFVGDHLPHHVERINKVIQAERAGAGRQDDNFRLLNFWAWHVKEDQEAARAEAKVWLAMRATPWPQFYHQDILPADEMKVVYANLKEINTAYYKRDPGVIKGVPKDMLDRLVDQCSSTSAISNLDHEIDRLRRFRAAGLTDIALRIYDDPAASIRLIGEKVMPAFA